MDWLEHLFPDRSPDLAHTDREIWFNAGRAEMVRWLRMKLEAQNQRAKRTTHTETPT